MKYFEPLAKGDRVVVKSTGEKGEVIAHGRGRMSGVEYFMVRLDSLPGNPRVLVAGKDGLTKQRDAA